MLIFELKLWDNLLIMVALYMYNIDSQNLYSKYSKNKSVFTLIIKSVLRALHATIYYSNMRVYETRVIFCIFFAHQCTGHLKSMSVHPPPLYRAPHNSFKNPANSRFCLKYTVQGKTRGVIKGVKYSLPWGGNVIVLYKQFYLHM